MPNLTTKDLTLAAALRSEGYEVSHLTTQGNIGTFTFKDVPADVVQRFDLGNFLVDPTAFHGALRQLTTAAKNAANRQEAA